MSHAEDKPAGPAKANAEFVVLLLKHERQVYAYIFSLLGNHDDAEEVLQETSIVLWDKFDEFTSGTDFAAWAVSTAHYQVLRFRKQKQRGPLQFSDEFIERIAASSTEEQTPTGGIHQALEHCLSQLGDEERSLLAARYATNARVSEIATDLGSRTQTIYTRLKRIRRRLLLCIEQASKQEEEEA